MAVEARKLTNADYAAFPDDGCRWELIDGEAFVTPSPNTRHQDIVLRLVFALETHLRHHGDGRVFVAPYDVVLADSDVVQPDIVFVSDTHLHRITEANLRGSPTMVVEVLSEPRHDRVRKRDLYARHGVAEYWIVDPDADRVEVHRLAGSTYPKPEILELGDRVTTPELPGFELDVSELFAR